jgi:hypothetical protein
MKEFDRTSVGKPDASAGRFAPVPWPPFRAASAAASPLLSLLICGHLLCMVAPAQPLNPVGIDQPVAVIVTRYSGTEIPPFTSADWAAAMNDRINAHYRTATAGQTSFRFIPIPGVFQFPFTYAETAPPDVAGFDLEDDPLVIFREVHTAIGMVLSANPAALDAIGRVVVVLNRHKRARAISEKPFVYLSAARPVISASACIIVDPFTQRRASRGVFSLEVTADDRDGDGLTDAQEEAARTNPDAPDSDNDGLLDGTEVGEGLNPNDPNTDADAFDDWEEWVLESDAASAAVTPMIPDNRIGVAIHEIGHQLGLGDLYRLDFGGTPEPYEYWDVMAIDNSQNFSAFSRQDAGWTTNGNGVHLLDIGPNGLDETAFVVAPPALSGSNGLEILRIRRPNIAELLLEARPTLDLDASRPAVLFNRLNRSGLPATYEPGLLISQTDQRYAEEGSLLRLVTGVPVSRILPQFGSAECSPEVGMQSTLRGIVQGPASLEWFHGVRPEGDAFLQISVDGSPVEVIEGTVNSDGEFEFQELSAPLQIPSGTHEVLIEHRTPPGTAGGDAFLSGIRILHSPVITHPPESVAAFIGQSRSLSVVVSLASLPDARYQWERRVGSSWQLIPAATNASLTLAAVSPADAGEYRVIVSNNAGDSISDPATLTVFDRLDDPVSSILNQPGRVFTQSSITHPWVPTPDDFGIQTSPALPPNLPVSLTTPIDGPAEVSFRWFRSNPDSSLQFFVGNDLAATQSEAGFTEVNAIVPAGTHTVRWTFSRTAAAGIGMFFNLEIRPAPRILRPPEPVVAAVGDSASMRVLLNAADTSGFTFRWYRNNTVFVPSGGSTLTLDNLTTNIAGEFKVEVLTPLTNLVSPTVTLTVLDPETGAVPLRMKSAQSTWFQEGCVPSWRASGNSDLRSVLPNTYFYAAAVATGDRFVDDAGLTIEAVPLSEVADPAEHPAGSLAVRIRSEPPPGAADLEIVHGWLDSPGNGLGTFFFGTGGEFNDPNLGGDPVFRRWTVIPDWGSFPPTFLVIQTALNQRIEYRVRNAGTATAHNVTGVLYYMPLSLPLGLNLNSRVALEQVATEIMPVSLGDLDPGESVIVRGEYTTFLPFQTVLLLDPAANEPNTSNNSLLASFLMILPSFGSPYERVDVPLDVLNLNEVAQVVFPQVLGLPDGWTTTSVDPANGQLKEADLVQPGDATRFVVQIQPPDPEVDQRFKPGTVQPIRVQGWMNLRDEYVPYGEIPVVVVLTHPTRISLDVKDTPPQAVLTGTLEYRPLASQAFEALGDRPVEIAISGSDGTVQTLALVTDASGHFNRIVDATPGVAYSAVAQFYGGDQQGSSVSAPVTWGEANENALRGIRLNRASVRENSTRGTAVGTFQAVGAVGAVSFQLVEGEGSGDNPSFAIDGARLVADAVLDFEEKPRLSVRVEARDQDTRSRFEQTFVISVTNDDDEDADRDGLREAVEDKAGSSDENPDSDGDAVPDEVEVRVGTDPASAESHPVVAWKADRQIRFDRPVAAHWWREGEIVVARTSANDEGIHVIGSDGSPRMLAPLKGVVALAVAPSGDIYASDGPGGGIYRLEASDRTATPWVSALRGTDSTPWGLAFLARGAPVPPAKDGLGIVAAHGARSGGVWEFSLDRPDEIARLDSNADSSLQPVDLALAGDRVVVAARATDASAGGVYRLGLEGGLFPLNTARRFRNPRGTAWDFLTGNLLVVDQSDRGSEVLELDPFSGAMRIVVAGLSSDVGIAGIDLDESAQRLLVTDYSANSILEFRRDYGNPPGISSVEPATVRKDGGFIIKGRFLEETTQVTVGGSAISEFDVTSSSEIRVRVAGHSSGFVQVTTPFGVATSPTPVQVGGDLPDVELSPMLIGENLPAGTFIGRLRAARPTGLAFTLAPATEFPHNAAFQIVRDAVLSTRPFDYEQQSSYRLGVVATDPFGETRTFAFIVSVVNRPEIRREPESMAESEGGQARFTVETVEEEGLSFQWLRDGAAIPGATRPGLEIAPLTTGDAGRYTVLVSSAIETIQSRAATLDVIQGAGRIVITDVQDLDGATLQLTVEGATSGEYVLEASLAVAIEWSDLQRVPASARPVTVVAPIDSSAPARLYRIRWEAP